MLTTNPVAVPSREISAGPQALTRLKPERVEAGLRKLPNWRQSRDGRSLVRTFKFAAERASIVFAELILALAAKEGHQPAVTLWNGTVECKLTTTAAGGITQRDFEMARTLNLLG